MTRKVDDPLANVLSVPPPPSLPPSLSPPPSLPPSLPPRQVKLELQQSEMYVSVTTLQEERSELLALKDTLQKYVRQLEQNNDDLERGKR